jgi:hypothetical protein
LKIVYFKIERFSSGYRFSRIPLFATCRRSNP